MYCLKLSKLVGTTMCKYSARIQKKVGLEVVVEL